MVHANNNKDVHTAACYKPGKQEYTDNTTPNAKWLDGTTSGLRVWDWGAAGATMHYKIGSPVTGILQNTGADNTVVYPNPMIEGTLKIDLSNHKTDAITHITIQDVQGKIVYTNDVQQNAILTIDTDTFRSGMYFVNLQNGSFTENYKVVKQ
ncbi:MAG TPA: T9SS type A sorting domain-containing protein [Bacteroidia bacterium]|nr:T9SS type A sorting domain-containing protein [Bacteroidia bacterium]HRG52175.1 T9SS type A sorting domain-containing protein [Bacteroidia bacterium]